MKKLNYPNVLTILRADQRSRIALLFLVLLLNMIYSCSYYTYHIQEDRSPEEMSKLYEPPNYIIIHQEDQVYHLGDLVIDQDNELITGTLQELPFNHKSYLTTKPRPHQSNRYSPSMNSGVHNEVHFYTSGLELNVNTSISIPLSSISRIEVYDRDIGTSILAFIGGAAIAMAVLVAIILLTKSSCPFVFIQDGAEYSFVGEINSGAIFRNLERDDYLLLPRIDTDSIELIIANRLKEKQYINQMSLIEVQHSAGMDLLLDQSGTPHTVNREEPFVSAFVDHQDISSLLQDRDSLAFTFNSEQQKDYFNEVILSFTNSASSDSGHLILRGKNSIWGDYVFGEFTKLFGRDYSKWIDKQNNSTEPVHENWAAEQGLSMIVLMEQGMEWTPIDTVSMVGPLSFRDWVIPVDLSQQHNSIVRIKLRTGFMMWDLDYVAMDYSADEDMTYRIITPAIAVNQDGEDMIAVLSAKDNQYMEQPNVGDQTTITFPASKKADESIEYDYILFSRGYYNHIRDYQEEPDMSALNTFKKPGRFSRFSKEKLDEIIYNLQFLASSPIKE